METTPQLARVLKVRVTEHTQTELELRAAAEDRSVASLVRLYIAAGLIGGIAQDAKARRV